jgi:hypothetical protein
MRSLPANVDFRRHVFALQAAAYVESLRVRLTGGYALSPGLFASVGSLKH